ncbi:MAG: hypothetical protein ABSC22_10875 [Roseiarcus sp.]
MATDEQLGDAILIEALHNALEAARQCFAHYDNQERLGVWLPHPSPNIDEISLPVRAAMETHPQFKEATSRFFGSKQLMLSPWYQSRNLLRVSVAHGPTTAVAWYRKVLSRERAALRYVAEVYGLKTDKKVVLKNGVSLVPLENLPASENARMVQAQFHFTPNNLPLTMTSMPIGAVIETAEIPYHLSYEQSAIDKVAPPRSDELERTIRAFSLVDGAAPVVGTSWQEFVDDDLRMAEAALIRMMPQHEGRRPFSPIDVDGDAIQWVERYLKLKPDVRPRCDVAIERLNLARRRYSSGNTAIEGAICLEALLGDGNQEINFKLRLRAALLLSTDLEERRDISKAVANFYKVRSGTVHGVPVKTADVQNYAAYVTRGLEICAQVLRTIVSLNEPFVPEDWELSGGQPHPRSGAEMPPSAAEGRADGAVARDEAP